MNNTIGSRTNTYTTSSTSTACSTIIDTNDLNLNFDIEPLNNIISNTIVSVGENGNGNENQNGNENEDDSDDSGDDDF